MNLDERGKRMKKHKKLLKHTVSLLWIFMFVCCISGCGAQQTQNTQEETQQETFSVKEGDAEQMTEESAQDNVEARTESVGTNEGKSATENAEEDREATEENVEQNTEEDRETTKENVEQNTEEDREATEENVEQNTEEDREATEENVEQNTEEDRETTEENVEQNTEEDRETTEENVEQNAEEDKEATEENVEQNAEESGEATKENTVQNREENQQAETAVEEMQVSVPSASGALHIEGTQLMDSNGNPIQLRGISTHGLAWFPQYVNQEFFHELRKEWDSNVVRLAMYTAESGGYCSDGNKENLKQLVKEGVKYATNADMYVIIDWHILSDGNPNTYKEEAKKFFEEMSKEYCNASNVLYEICNEPNGGTTWADVKSYAEEIIPIIRENDEDAIIIVGTPTWSQDVDKVVADPIEGYDNIMYALHFYAATHTDWLRNRMEQVIDAGLPIFVTEFGTCDASGNGGIDRKQSSEWIQTMDENSVSYVAWNLSNKAETSAIFRQDCQKTFGFAEEDLSENGKWIYEMLTGEDTGGLSGDFAEEDKALENNPSHNDSNHQTQGDSVGNQNNESNHDENQSDVSNHESSNHENNSVQGTNDNLKVTASINNSWESEGEFFYQYVLELENSSDTNIDEWAIELVFNEKVTFSSGWNGNYTVNDTTIEITCMDYNGKIPAGEKVSDIGFIISGGEKLAIKE